MNNRIYPKHTFQKHLKDMIRSIQYARPPISDPMHDRREYNMENNSTYVAQLADLVPEDLPSLQETTMYVQPIDFDRIRKAVCGHRLTKKMNVLETSNYENRLYVHLPNGKKVKIVGAGGKNNITVFLKFMQWYSVEFGSVNSHKFDLL